MADQLKTFFSPALVRRLAKSISDVHPAFAARAFVKRASTGLDALELLARAKHIADALAAHLPAYPDAIDILLRSLGPEHASDELLGVGIAPFFYMPHTIFVAERGLDHFDLSMRAQYELTKRFSAESSIRAYIDRDPERAWRFFETWAVDPNPHVRRLVSEGTRLRLPWARRVAFLDQHPERVVELLALLRDDPTTLVRRSVANNLNDLGKVHPALLFETCAAWIDGRRPLVEHALRSAVKRGEPAALEILGFGKRAAFAIEDVRITPARVAIGGRVTIEFALRSTARRTQELLVDLAVHFVKANRATSAKVFKLDRTTLAPRDRVELAKTISLAVHTTRKPYPGRHDVDVVVNGARQRVGTFTVT